MVHPWSLPLDAEPAEGAEEDAALGDPSDDARRLLWIDQQGEPEAWRFAPWKNFEHPELGPVEVGGFAPYGLIEPPPATRAQLATEHLAFLTSLGSELARIRFGDVTVTSLGGELHDVRATLVNDGLLPLFTVAGERSRTTRPARVPSSLWCLRLAKRWLRTSSRWANWWMRRTSTPCVA